MKYNFMVYLSTAGLRVSYNHWTELSSILGCLITQEIDRLHSPQSEQICNKTNYCVILKQLRFDALLNVSNTLGLYLSLKISFQKRSFVLRHWVCFPYNCYYSWHYDCYQENIVLFNSSLSHYQSNINCIRKNLLTAKPLSYKCLWFHVPF
jgi:hypothetical protein